MQWSMQDVVKETLAATTEAELVQVRRRVIGNRPPLLISQRIEHLIPQRDRIELAKLGPVPTTWPRLVGAVRRRNLRRAAEREASAWTP